MIESGGQRALFPVVALVLMTVLVWLSFGGDEQQTSQAPPVREPQARYYVTDVTVRSMDTNGQPSYMLTAARAAYFPDDDTWRMRSPRWRSLGDGVPWHGRADDGVLTPIETGRHRLRLSGDVELRRAGDQPLTLSTNALSLEPERRYAQTRVAVNVHTPLYHARARGARAWLDRGRVELLTDVRGSYAID